jgi:hypothetical protein
MSGGVSPDVRYGPPQSFRDWEAIVIGRSRAARGMRSFKGAITRGEALVARAYTLERAAKLR